MRKLFLLCLLPVFASQAAETPPDNSPRGGSGYLEVRVDRIEVDTAGLADASATLARSVDRLAASIDGLAQSDRVLDEAGRADLLRAVQSAERASNALAQMAERLPQTAQALTERLPEVVENARAPIAELSSGLRIASDGIIAITESLPVATQNARELVNSTIDAVLIRVSLYTLILIALLVLALIAVAWFIHARYLAPVARLFAPLAAAPGQFADLSRHLERSSTSLLELRRLETAPGRGRRRRRWRQSA